MKPGRNDPCPCGSGLKYKKCCALKAVTRPEELHYRRLSDVYNELLDRIAKHAAAVFGPDVETAALEEFWLWPDEEEELPDPQTLSRHMPLFWPWFVFNWNYEAMEGTRILAGPEGRTPAELYAEAMGDRLEALERRCIEDIDRRPYTFLEAMAVEPGKRIHVRDVLTGNDIWVQERSGSHTIGPGDILFGRAVDVDGVGMLIGLAPFIIPPQNKPEIVHLRQWMTKTEPVVTEQTLLEYDVEIREFFFNIEHRLHTPPSLANTDGDPLEFHNLVFAIDSPDDAFEKLASLCVTQTPQEILRDAERGKDGKIRRVEFDWNRSKHKGSAGLSNTVLGRITIEKRKLTASVNSARRAQTLRKKIQKLLGPGARFRIDKIQSVDAVMNEGISPGTPDKSAEHEALMAHPEVQEQIETFFRKHWEGWVKTKIPALGGTTPLKAVRTADGRESVEGLLAGAERMKMGDPVTEAMNRKGIQRARELLGLFRSEPGEDPGD